MSIEILVKISVLESSELKEMFVYTSVFSAEEELLNQLPQNLQLNYLLDHYTVDAQGFWKNYKINHFFGK